MQQREVIAQYSPDRERILPPSKPIFARRACCRRVEATMVLLSPRPSPPNFHTVASSSPYSEAHVRREQPVMTTRLSRSCRRRPAGAQEMGNPGTAMEDFSAECTSGFAYRSVVVAQRKLPASEWSDNRTDRAPRRDARRGPLSGESKRILVPPNLRPSSPVQHVQTATSSRLGAATTHKPHTSYRTRDEDQ